MKQRTETLLSVTEKIMLSVHKVQAPAIVITGQNKI